MTYTIDCSALADKAAFHTALAQTLSFPPYYGGNLDALYDMLTSARQTELILLDLDPDRFAPFVAVFEDAAAENRKFTFSLLTKTDLIDRIGDDILNTHLNAFLELAK